jgi:hypothetical protein
MAKPRRSARRGVSSGCDVALAGLRSGESRHPKGPAGPPIYAYKPEYKPDLRQLRFQRDGLEGEGNMAVNLVHVLRHARNPEFLPSLPWKTSNKRMGWRPNYWNERGVRFADRERFNIDDFKIS